MRNCRRPVTLAARASFDCFDPGIDRAEQTADLHHVDQLSRPRNIHFDPVLRYERMVVDRPSFAACRSIHGRNTSGARSPVMAMRSCASSAGPCVICSACFRPCVSRRGCACHYPPVPCNARECIAEKDHISSAHPSRAVWWDGSAVRCTRGTPVMTGRARHPRSGQCRAKRRRSLPDQLIGYRQISGETHAYRSF